MSQEPDLYEDHPSDDANGFGYDSEDQSSEDDFEDDEDDFEDDFENEEPEE